MISPRRISVNLSEAEYKSLNSIANRYRVSMAWLGRHAILDFIERYRTEELQLPLDLSKNRRTAL